MGQICTGQPGLNLIRIDDGNLNAAKHFDCLLHFAGVTESNGHRVTDHHHGHRGHQHLGARHSNNGCCGGSDAVNLDCDITLVVHQHIVDLGSCHAVTTRRVDPDGDIPGARHQLILEKLRRDIIVKPVFLSNRAV